MKKNILLIVSSVFCLLSCGIERTIPILQPPIAGISAESSDTFIFSNSVEDEKNIKSFKGFEIYYKFYETSEAADIEKNITSHKLIADAGFLRLNRFTDSERIYKPLIEIPEENKTGISKFIIDFSSLNHVFISAVSESGNGIAFSDFSIYRGVKNEYLEYKDFSSVEKTDSDLKLIKDISKEMYLAIYIFSYGIHELSQELYSAPVWLNKIQLLY